MIICPVRNQWSFILNRLFPDSFYYFDHGFDYSAVPPAAMLVYSAGKVQAGIRIMK